MTQTVLQWWNDRTPGWEWHPLTGDSYGLGIAVRSGHSFYIGGATKSGEYCVPVSLDATVDPKATYLPQEYTITLDGIETTFYCDFRCEYPNLSEADKRDLLCGILDMALVWCRAHQELFYAYYQREYAHEVRTHGHQVTASIEHITYQNNLIRQSQEALIASNKRYVEAERKRLAGTPLF